ncbi:MAG: DNA polymerase III subunit alpha, partial [Actinomycetota bacterium]|nr:DNA polymerase III subunit alpha [Actinomycetota bacterium]
KKKRDLIAKERSKFVAGCEANGYGREFGEKMFGIIEPFADYSFNKSHSVGYGFVAYQTAYLKAHHPVEYLAALLTSVKDDKDKTAVYLAECRALGIPVLVPDVNVAESDFVGKEGSIPFGLSAVRNVGEGIVAHIVAEREANGPYRDFADFCSRVHPSVLNKRALESLIKAGAFDSLGHPRKGLLGVFERIADAALGRRREAEAGVMSLFGESTPEGGPPEIDRVDVPDVEFDKTQRLVFEKEMLGLYVSDHPLMGAQAALARHVEHTLTECKELPEGAIAVVGGVVTALTRRYTKRGELMATFVLEDLEAAVEVMVFPRTMTDFGHLLTEDAVVCVKGRLDRRDDQAKLVAVEVRRPELVLDGDGAPVRLRVPASRLTEAFLAEIKRVLEAHPGESPVLIHVEDGRRTTVLRLGPAFGVSGGNGLHAELRVLLGADGVF